MERVKREVDRENELTNMFNEVNSALDNMFEGNVFDNDFGFGGMSLGFPKLPIQADEIKTNFVPRSDVKVIRRHKSNIDKMMNSIHKIFSVYESDDEDELNAILEGELDLVDFTGLEELHLEILM
jgi:predicted homoserine dehydrogenase-like protein